MPPQEAKFRKKSVTIRAYRLLGKSIEINTLEGTMIANDSDWIITGINDEQYPCKDEIFRKTYEPIDEKGAKMLLQKETKGVRDKRSRRQNMRVKLSTIKRIIREQEINKIPGMDLRNDLETAGAKFSDADYDKRKFQDWILFDISNANFKKMYEVLETWSFKQQTPLTWKCIDLSIGFAEVDMVDLELQIWYDAEEIENQEGYQGHYRLKKL